MKKEPTQESQAVEPAEAKKVLMVELTKGQAGALKRGMDQINALAAEQARVEGMVKSAAQVQNGFVQAIIEDGGLAAEDFASGYGIWEEDGKKYLRPNDPPVTQVKQ